VNAREGGRIIDITFGISNNVMVVDARPSKGCNLGETDRLREGQRPELGPPEGINSWPQCMNEY
jgi:hypothetical protein